MRKQHAIAIKYKILMGLVLIAVMLVAYAAGLFV